MNLLYKDQKIVSLAAGSYGFIAGSAACQITPLIQSENEAHFFYQNSQNLDEQRRKSPHSSPFPLRMGSLQMSSLITEWDTVSAQRLWLTCLSLQEGLSAQTAHYLLPTEPLFHPNDQEPPSEFLLKDLLKLTKYFNIAALELYCYWLAEEIEVMLEKIKLESVELYTLEGLFKHFLHEVRAGLLRNSESNFQENILAQGALQGRLILPHEDKRSIIEIERAIFRTYTEGVKRLQEQNRILIDISNVMNVHKEFILFKQKALLISELLTYSLDLDEEQSISWPRHFMLVQAINRLLGVVSGVNTSRGHDRSLIGFATQLALSALEQTLGVDAVTELILNWDALTNAYDEKKKQLRKRIWHAIKQVAIPIASHEKPALPSSSLEGQSVNENIVELLPSALTTEGRTLLCKLV